MTKLTTKIFGASLSALAFSLPATTLAQTCIVPPTCEELGFIKTSTDCAGKTILKCPFDKAQVYCPGYEENSKTYNLGDTYLINDIPVGKVIEVSDCSGGSTSDDITVAQCLSNSGCPNYTMSSSGSGSSRVYTWTCIGNNKIIATSSSNNMNDFSKTCNYKNSGNQGCKHGIIATTGTRTGTIAEASKGCSDMTTGGLSWYLPTNGQIAKIYTYVSKFSGYVWDHTGKCGNSNGDQIPVLCYSASSSQAECHINDGVLWQERHCSSNVITNFTMGYFCVAAF